MYPSVAEAVRQNEAALKAARKKCSTPAGARAFLLKAGILEKHAASKNGVRLAKQYR